MPHASDLIASLPTSIDGYDIAAEKARYGHFPDVTAGGVTLNRGRARVEVRGDMEAPRHAKVREEALKHLYITTHAADSPVVELGWPVAGSYVACEAGVYLDCQLGVAQKLLDENHPAYAKAIERLARHRLLFRREIATDDFLEAAPFAAKDIHPPQAVAALVAQLAEEAFPIVGRWKVFFSNSGTEAVEAGMKLAMLVRWRRLVEKHGGACAEELMRQLETPRNERLEARDHTMPDPVWRDYPLWFFAFEGAFHGRTLGALSLTQSKKAHQIGYGKLRVKHFPWNAGATVADAIDSRELPEVLAAEGGVRRVLAQGRVPKDLVAAFVAEPFQGEGGYRLADKKAMQDLGGVLRRNGILFMLDEVQTFGRTGAAFCSSHFLNEPDIIATAKGAVVGITLGRAEFDRYLHPGWHSNTWGGGKIFDNEMAWATLDALRSYRDPVLDGLPYFDNARVKGKYLAAALDRLAERYPDILVDHSGIGLMHGITVRRRDEVVAEAWRRGLKLLGCGLPGETARIRLLFLADAIAKEIDDFATTFDGVLAALSKKRAAAPAAAAKS